MRVPCWVLFGMGLLSAEVEGCGRTREATSLSPPESTAGAGPSTLPDGTGGPSTLPDGTGGPSALPDGTSTASPVRAASPLRAPLPVRAPSPAPTEAAGDVPAPADAGIRELRFTYRPRRGPVTPYATPAPEDQPRIVFLPGVERGRAYSVVVALHGQPRRGARPRDYEFAPIVLRVAEQMVRENEVSPFVVALPVFRFDGENWPGFDLGEFRERLDGLLATEGIRADAYFVFGHSGAAGCGGGGLNGAARMSPKGAAFLDTCVGPAFVESVRQLARARVPTVVVHSVETAGFVPRQPTEYRTDFDFGQVDRQLGLAPVDCPSERPRVALREQPFRCSATVDGTVRGFVVDTGSGEPAHQAAIEVGMRYFLRTSL